MYTKAGGLVKKLDTETIKAAVKDFQIKNTGARI